MPQNQDCICLSWSYRSIRPAESGLNFMDTGKWSHISFVSRIKTVSLSPKGNGICLKPPPDRDVLMIPAE